MCNYNKKVTGENVLQFPLHPEGTGTHRNKELRHVSAVSVLLLFFFFKVNLV